MNIAHIRKYAGTPVIVQLREAMALGHVSGPMQASPVCNEQGELLKKDGSVAPKDAKPEEVAFRPAWPIAVRRDDKDSPEFRFAIEGAMVTVIERHPSLEDAVYAAGDPLHAPPPGPLVFIHYAEGTTLYELAVEPDAIIGITCVRQGPMAEEEQRSSLIVPGRN